MVWFGSNMLKKVGESWLIGEMKNWFWPCKGSSPEGFRETGVMDGLLINLTGRKREKEVCVVLMKMDRE